MMAEADNFYARNRAWLRTRINDLRLNRHNARIAGDVAMVAAIDASLAYYRAASMNNEGHPFP